MRKFSAWIYRHHKKLLIVSTFLSFFYFLWDINSWKYSFVGDMWQFYVFAKQILLSNYNYYPFSFNGVFGFNSVISSMYQALFMDLFGISNFAWRLSNIVLIFPLSYFFYRWLRLTFDWKIATISTLLLQCSLYLSVFFKIGYINPQSLVLFVTALYFAALSGLYPTKRNEIILGLILGFSFYIYIGPLFPLLVWPYLLPLLKNKNKRKTLVFFLSAAIPYLFFLLLVLPDLQSIIGPQSKTVIHKEFTDPQQIITNIGNNLLVFYKDFNVIYTHFIPFPYLDGISQLFALIGTIAVILLGKEKNFRDLLFVYLSTVIILGVTNPYTIPPTSRGMFLVIFGFIFTAFGLLLVNKAKYFQGKIIIPVLCCIILLNIYQAKIASFEKTGYTGMALIMKSLMQAHNQSQSKVVLILSETQMITYYIVTIQTMQEAYGLNDVRLTVLKPQLTQCEIIANKEIILFAHDTQSISWLSNNKCESKYPYSYTILSPRIWYY